MNIQNPSFPTTGAPGSPLLQAFEHAAATHDAVRITLDGTDFQVHGVGVMPQSRREVAWVSAADAQTDTTSVFVAALNQSFTSGIATAVARELDLRPAPGMPLASRSVQQALDMAQTGSRALSGVDFFTRLQFSAGANGLEFRQVCETLGRDHTAFTAAERQHIDTQMDQRFAQAQAQGVSPVGRELAEQWLRDALQPQ